jgi:Domain of unknown function (DUF4386)
MTARASARLAGVLFLAYIATGLTQMALDPTGTPAGAAPAEVLARYASHPVLLRADVLLTLLTAFEALFLGGALYALTRRVDPDLALLALLCRVAEGSVNAVAALGGASRIALAAAAVAATTDAHDAVGATTALLLRSGGGTVVISGTCFAMGSTIFAWLFLRGRLVPAWLARLGVVASLLVLVLLPAQWLGLEGSWVPLVMWLPALVFEVGLGGWLIVKGVAVSPAPADSSPPTGRAT